MDFNAIVSLFNKIKCAFCSGSDFSLQHVKKTLVLLSTLNCTVKQCVGNPIPQKNVAGLWR